MMRILSIFVFILLSTLIFAQEMPLVYDVENTGGSGPIPYLPSFSELPINSALPDPFTWTDGRGRIENFYDWRYRRNEIRAEIENYEIGLKPTRPDTITASYSDNVLTVIITVNSKTLTLTSEVYLPAGTGPFPTVIGMNSPNGSIPGDIFTSRDIARITYHHNNVTTYYAHSNSDPYYQLYPNLNTTNTGQYSAWAWGVSRLIDGLELVQDDLPIDMTHIAVTGCSYAGKMALFAGAFDERIALTIAQESGGGGAPSWRYSHSEPTGTVEKIDNTDYSWFMNSMNQFSGDNVWRMPEDHHELMAMVAPRALLVTGNTSSTWLSNPSCYVSSKACQEVYSALGISDRFGYYIDGGHNHCAIPVTQVPAIEAFVDKFLLGIDTVNTDIAVTPFTPDLAPWINWTTPVLGTDSSYFGKATLVYPVNKQIDVDSSITLKWNVLEDAQEYVIQVSTNSTFQTDVTSDSTADTLKVISNLQEGNRYYWRVQAKNSSEKYGPWSQYWNFVTLPLPSNPELFYPTQSPDQNSSYTFSWSKTLHAEKYYLQLSRQESFSTITTVSTTDTFEVLSGLLEGQKYYWRVQGENLAGIGEWSTSEFTSILYAPTDLELQINDASALTLNWTDNSRRESGYIIERKQNPQTIFSLLDTLAGSGNQYTDTSTVLGQTYTYRIKAFRDSVLSEYSNEASILFVGIKNENELPTEYALSQNYPNPFNPNTTINFALPKAGLTKIIVYDLLGRKIQTLINKKVDVGYHSVNFNASKLPGGLYFYRIKSGEFTQARKMILMK